MKKKNKKKELSLGYLLAIFALLVTATIGAQILHQDLLRENKRAMVEEDNSDVYRDGMVYDDDDDFELYVSEEVLGDRDLDFYSLNKVTAKTIKAYLEEVSRVNNIELETLLNDFRYIDLVKESILEYDEAAYYLSFNNSKEAFLNIYDGDIEEDIEYSTVFIVRSLLENSARSYYREVINYIEKGNVENLAVSLSNSADFLNVVSSFDDVKLLETLRGLVGEEI